MDIFDSFDVDVKLSSKVLTFTASFSAAASATAWVKSDGVILRCHCLVCLLMLLL